VSYTDSVFAELADDNNDDVYSPKQKKKNQSSNSKKIKLTDEVWGYGQNGYVYKCLYDNKQMVVQLKNESEWYQHFKRLKDVYIPNKIISGYLKNFN